MHDDRAHRGAVAEGHARAVPEAGIDHHCVARLHRRDVGTDRVHDARPVGPEDVRETLLAGKAAHDEEIQVVERGGAHRHPHLPGAEQRRRARRGHIRDFYLLELARRANDARAHCASVGRYNVGSLHMGNACATGGRRRARSLRAPQPPLLAASQAIRVSLANAERKGRSSGEAHPRRSPEGLRRPWGPSRSCDKRG